MKNFPKKEEITETIKKFPKVKEIILFGSRAKGTHSKYSDIDVAVKTEGKMSIREKRLLKEYLDKAAGIYTVDLLFYEELSSEMKKTVDMEGVTIWKR